MGTEKVVRAATIASTGSVAVTPHPLPKPVALEAGQVVGYSFVIPKALKAVFEGDIRVVRIPDLLEGIPLPDMFLNKEVVKNLTTLGHVYWVPDAVSRIVWG